MIDRRTNPETEIEDYRRSIDAIDDDLLALMNRRLTMARAIGRLKSQGEVPVFDPVREARILKRLVKGNPGPLPESALRRIFTEVFSASRDLQKPQRISYLGPEATFTHIAAVGHFGSSVIFTPRDAIGDVFADVEKEICDYGVVPVENSIEGAVNHTLDLFPESELRICAEIYRPITHALLSQCKSSAKIAAVYSHPQALAQCRRYLERELPNARRIACASTAKAAEMAATEPRAAAIAAFEAASIYGLSVLADHIEDTARNTTRFLVIGKDDCGVSGDDKTSLMFVTAHVPGALHRTLKPLADAGVNMVKLESRPARHENWNYVFFVDVEGHIQNRKIRNAVSEMKSLSLFVKHLGSYPRAIHTTTTTPPKGEIS